MKNSLVFVPETPKAIKQRNAPQSDGGTRSLRQLPLCPRASADGQLPPVWSSPPASAPGQATATRLRESPARPEPKGSPRNVL